MNHGKAELNNRAVSAPRIPSMQTYIHFFVCIPSETCMFPTRGNPKISALAPNFDSLSDVEMLLFQVDTGEDDLSEGFFGNRISFNI